MQDDFNLYEWKDTLREQSINGLDASTKVIEFLRSKIYPKLSDDEMDKFIIAIADHLSLDVPSYRLDEQTVQTIKLDDLTFDQLGPKPMFGFDAQNNDDSSTKLHNDDDLKPVTPRRRGCHVTIAEDVSFKPISTRLFRRQTISANLPDTSTLWTE